MNVIDKLKAARKQRSWVMIDNLISELEYMQCGRNHISEMREPVTIEIGNYRLLGFKNAKTGVISVPDYRKKISMKLSNLDTYRHIRNQVKQYKLITNKIEANGYKLGK